MYAGVNKIDLTKDTVYTHPSSKQCNWVPDSSNFYSVGSYTGDGSVNRLISIGFTPKAVFVFTPENNHHDTAAFAVEGQITPDNNMTGRLSCTTGGFIVQPGTGSSPLTNRIGIQYMYIAFK